MPSPGTAKESPFRRNQFLGEQFLSNFWLNNFSYPGLSPATPASQPPDPISKKAKCLEGFSYTIVFAEIWSIQQNVLAS